MGDNHQSAFIRNVRRALGKPLDGCPSAPMFHIPPDDLDNRLARYRDKSPQKRQVLLDELIARAEAVNMRVSVVADATAAGAAIRDLVLEKSPEWGSEKRIVTWDHPLMDDLGLGERLAGDQVPVTVTRLAEDKDTADERLRLRQEVEAAYIGVTSADFVVAHTATLVMKSRPGHLRSVSLVPCIHVCVAHTDQVVSNLEELYTLLQWNSEQQKQGLTNCMTFISAPSKTGDIELVMVNGAHGPREVHLILITD